MRCDRIRWLLGGLAVFVTFASAVAARPTFSVKRVTGLSIGTRGAQSIALADLNNDGRADILAVGTGADEVDVFLNDGTGGFPSAPVAYATQHGPRAVTSGDFDRDGKADIAVVNDDNTLTLLFNEGTGHFGHALSVDLDPDNPGPVGVVAADFDGDHADDLAVLAPEAIYLLKSNGDRTFSPFGTRPLRTLGADGFAITSGLLNADNFVDLVTSNAGSNNVSVLLGNGDGTFQHAKLFGVGQMPQGIVVDQLNGDTVADVAVIAGVDVDSAVWLLFGKGDGTFVGPVSTTDEVSSNAIAALDIDRDGKVDLASTNTSGGVGVVLLCQQPSSICTDIGPPFGNPIENGFQLQVAMRFGEAISIQAGELNGDARPDFIVLGASGDEIGIFINTTGQLTPTPTASAMRTPSPTPVPSSIPSPTPILVATPRVRLSIGSVAGRPGDQVEVVVSLESPGVPVGATGNQILFQDRRVLSIPQPLTNFEGGGEVHSPTPPCRINPAIGKSLVSSFDLLEFPAELARFFVLSGKNAGPIPDGPLYSCTVQIAPSVLPGTYPIVDDLVLAVTPDGQQIDDVGANNGYVTVALILPTQMPTARGQGGGGCSLDGGNAVGGAWLSLVVLLLLRATHR